jgi:hypothetical protein
MAFEADIRYQPEETVYLDSYTLNSFALHIELVFCYEIYLSI